MVSNEANDEPCALNTEIDGVQILLIHRDAEMAPGMGLATSNAAKFHTRIKLIRTIVILKIVQFHCLTRTTCNVASSGKTSINKAFDSNSTTFWSSARNEVSNWAILGGHQVVTCSKPASN